MYRNYIKILKTPKVLRGFDTKGGDIVLSQVHGEKELQIVSQGKVQRLCRGFLPLFLGDDILYSNAEMGDRTDIFLYQKGRCINLTREGRNLAPQPSPDGKLIAFLSDRGGPLSLYLLDLEEKKSTCLVTPEKPLSLRPFVWSPCGEYIVYWTQKKPGHSGGIWRVQLETRKTEQLIYFPESSIRVGSPYVWYLSDVTPVHLKSNVWIDQNQFIFLSDARGCESFGISTLEGEIEWIDSKSEGGIEFYEVSPDGKWIAYNEYADGTTHLVFLSLEEGVRKEVRTNGCLSCPKWSEKGVYCWGSSPTEGTGILYVPPEGEPEYVYKEPPPFSTFQPVPVHYKTFDNKKIGAWLYNPEAKKVLVWLHGGPADVCLNNFDPVIQYFALCGYAVFAPNFRGSLGYGKEFEKLNWNDLGGGDLKDVIEGISYLRRQGYGPFVVAGQSYGAYLASMVLVKYPGVCEGGVCISGMYTLFPEHASHWLINSGCFWMDLEDRELSADRSPVYHVENLVDPVFVIHGVLDQYTPISSLQYVLKKAQEVGKDGLFTVTVYDDEGHGLTKEDHIKESYGKIVKFLKEATG